MEKKVHKIKVEFEVIVKNEDIDDIMCGALEGGINYWCYKAEVVEDDYFGEYASEQISRGGSLNLYDNEEDAVYLLTKEKFMEGLKKYLENPCCGDFIERKDGKIFLDTCNADAEVCDAIIQYAIFGDIVYG